MDKPTKPTNLMPRSFGGLKENFSESLQETGVEPNVPVIYHGANFNYEKDTIGKELDYCEKIVDFINGLPIGKTITTDSNNKLQYADLAQDVPIATTETAGIVKPDGETITITQDGTISANGSSRNIGEIVASTIPLTDAGLHLLDGALLQYGSYKDFIDYIADLYDSGDYDDIFETEANWQQSVTDYGVCGKFVYNSTNNTVRLPKYNSKIYTGGGTSPVVSNGLQPSYRVNGESVDRDFQALGGSTGGYDSVEFQVFSGLANGGYKSVIVGDESGLITDLTNITTSLEGYYYIVVATTTKTDIQVDIDEIVTDLNGKADVDLTNVNNSGTALGGSWAMPSNTYVDLTLGASGATYTAPANGWFALHYGNTSNPVNLYMYNPVTKLGLYIYPSIKK